MDASFHLVLLITAGLMDTWPAISCATYPKILSFSTISKSRKPRGDWLANVHLEMAIRM